MDENQIVASLVARVIHEKSRAAVELGRRGGLKGGKARAAKHSPARRKALPSGEMPQYSDDWLSGSASHFYQLRGAPKTSPCEMPDAALCAIDQRILQKNRTPSHAIGLHFMYYNFFRVHQTLRVTPAMEAGISDHIWTIEEVVTFLESERERLAA